MKIKHCLLSILLVLVFTVSANAYFKVELGPAFFPQSAIGRPIANAQIYVGIPDTDPEIIGNQKTLYVQQEDGTIIAVAQPIRTSMGGVTMYNGSPVVLLVDSDYSLKVLNSRGVQIYYTPSVDAWDSGSSIFNYCTPNYLAVDQGTVGALITVKSCIDAIGTDSATIYLKHNSSAATTTYTFATSEVVPSNIDIIIEKGAILSDDGGTANLTINKLQNPGLNKIFNWNGTGKVSFEEDAIKEIYPEWWGIDKIEDEIEINKAFISKDGADVLLQGKEYSINETILPGNNDTLRGTRNLTILKAASAATDYYFIELLNRSYVTLKDFTCDGNIGGRPEGLSCCIYMGQNAHHNIVKKLDIIGFGRNPSAGIYIRVRAEEIESGNTYENIISECNLSDIDGNANFGIRLVTEWTLPLASDAYTRFIKDNTIENCKMKGFAWNGIEIAGPATTHNNINNNIVIQGKVHTGIEVDKGSSYNKFIGNEIQSILPGDYDIYGFRCQGDPAAGAQPERRCLHNIFIGNSVYNLEITGTRQTGGFFITRSDYTIISDQIVADVTGAAQSCAGFFVGNTTNLIIDNASVNNVYTGILSTVSTAVSDIKITNGNYNVTGNFLTATAGAAFWDRIIVSNNNIQCGINGLLLASNNIIITNNYIKGPGSNKGIDWTVNSIGICTSNVFESFTDGVRVYGNKQIVKGNLFLSCTNNVKIAADLRSTVFANLGDTGTSTPAYTYDVAAPTTGTFIKGDIVFDLSPVAGGTMGWVCTTGGTPGTWKTFGAVTP